MLLRAGNDEVARYIALSHCWGGHVPVQTTKDTLQNHFEAVNLDSSSQTFLDAAQVCRDLGIRYLWIDSLCIVQDDEDDWAREAGKMSEVYRNAILTISAEGARNAKEGLFKQPETTICEQKNIDWKTSSGDPITLHVRLRGQSDHGPEAIGHFAHSSSETLHSELSDRAWVLQERLLSTRNIHFFSEEMAWSCCSVSRCECRIDADVTDMSVFKKLNVESASRPLIVEEMHREWTNLVMEFTRRKLTKIKDRLPAISGLAKLCGEVTLSKYYAGLFDHDLEYGLLWMSDYHAQSFLIYRNPKRPHMPTWSWASTTGPVKYFDRQRNQFERRTHGATVEPRFKVLEAEVSSRGSNLYSDVDRGMLKIKGQLLRVHYDKTKCHFRPWDETLASHMLPADIPFSTADLHTQDATTAEVSHMFPSTDPSKNQTLQLPQKAKTRQPQIIPDVLAEPPDMARTNEWYFLRAARYIPGGIYAYESSENVCLLLERLGAEAGMGLFKRRCFVLYGFPSKPFWEEEWAPTQMLGIV
ncbi:hypothetical protein PRZ48_012134 [Zasmidium cellare]|uniref:Heterokaryon incompatibility domain-containing protein n=1 Tax=Zasmidium cellare TaxID=395010 RepID=A0ABR0E433_ZASCE|nr:hypothetical protein PRZ48_012134 [Zasmidium cellare]